MLKRWRAWLVAARKRRQRMSLHTRLMFAWGQVHELRRYVDRDRRAERRERDRLVDQVRELRSRFAKLEDILRAHLKGYTIVEAELQAQRVREALASDFGSLDGGPGSSSAPG